MEMSPWTYTSAWHLWELHDLMPSIMSHLKASSVHLSHYLSSYKDSQQGKFMSSEIPLPFYISRSVQPGNEPMPLTVPTRRGAVVLALVAGTISILDPNDPHPAKLKLNAMHSGVSFMLKDNRTTSSWGPQTKVSLRSTKPLPSTLDSSKVLFSGQGSASCLLSGLHFLAVGTAQTISPAQVQQGRAEQTRVLAPSNLSAAGWVLLPVQREINALCSTSIKPTWWRILCLILLCLV